MYSKDDRSRLPHAGFGGQAAMTQQQFNVISSVVIVTQKRDGNLSSKLAKYTCEKKMLDMKYTI
jgi:hypothetical protein